MSTPVRLSSNLVEREGRVRAKLWEAGLRAAPLAAALNVVVWLISWYLLSLPLLIPAQPGTTELTPLPLVAVIMASAIPAFAATLLLALLNRFVSRPVLIFQSIAGLFLLGSFVPVLTMGVSAATSAVLATMHMVAAGAIVWALTARTR